MLYSTNKLNFVKNYIKSYENTIKVLNKSGNFSEAKIFENFALKICEFVFGESFVNMNVYKSNYPYVDLFCPSKNLYVQVSTVNDVPNKIVKTLSKIQKSKKKEFKNIKRLVFFVLNNESIQNLKSYKGKNKIGKISFDAKKDVITTATILDKCSDSDFLNKIYKLIFDDFISYFNVFEKYNDMISSSKSRIKIIKSTLGKGNFEINRDDLINKIINSDCKYNLVTGPAGSGKSSICKKVCIQFDNFIYIRAESFNNNQTLNSIFGFSLNDILPLLADNLVIFIDSLEFLSDVQEKQELLFELFDIANKNDKLKIILSCRSSDVDYFSQIFCSFNPTYIEVPLLQRKDIKKILESFENLKKFYEKDNYKDIFSNLLYLDILINNNNLFSVELDEKLFRNEIFKNVICLDKRAKGLSLDKKEIHDTVLKIVLDRAKKFVVAVDKSAYNPDIIDALISNNVLAESDNFIRFKFDMFEDICFEQIIDSKYNVVKKDIQKFFNELDKIGRCSYRRYQMWLSRKLADENVGTSLVYSILFDEQISSNWEKHTIIGLCNSDNCSLFFNSYKNDLPKEMIEKMIQSINLYSYKIYMAFNVSNKAYITLTPYGYGRGEIIDLIFKDELFKELPCQSIVKLCIDYIKGKQKNDDILGKTAKILEYLFDENKNEEFDDLKDILGGIYALSNFSKDWICKLWSEIEKDYLQNTERKHFADDVFEFTISPLHFINLYPLKSKYLQMVESFWLNDPKPKDLSWYHFNRELDNLPFYLNSHTNNNNFFDVNPLEKLFVFLLFAYDFKSGVDWVISFLNRLIIKSIKEGHSFNKIGLINGKEYYFDSDFTNYGFADYNNCYFLNSLIFSISVAIENLIDLGKDVETNLNYFKEKVINESNNGILFELVVFAGSKINSDSHFYREFCSSCEFMYCDFIRYSQAKPNELKKQLTDTIEKQIGVPGLRNKLKVKDFSSLRDTFLNFGLSKNSNDNNFYRDILSYLYLKYENTEYINFINSLTIENTSTNLEENNETKSKSVLEEIIDNLKKNGASLEEHKKLISIYETSDETSKIFLQELYILSLCNILCLSNVDEKTRENTCIKLLTFFENVLRGEGYYIGNAVILKGLFNQINVLKNEKLINRIYDFILLCVLNPDTFNNKSKEIVQAIELYVNENSDERIFNTLVNLGINEANRQEWYYKQLSKKELVDKSEFSFNVSRKLFLTDDQIINNNLLRFDNKENEIIEEILHKGNLNWKYETENKDFDLSTVINSFKLHLSLKNPHVLFVFKKTLQYLLRIRSNEKLFRREKYECFPYDFENFASSLINKDFDSYALAVVTILEVFADFDINQQNFQLFDNCFNTFASLYFDAYNNPESRHSLKKKIIYLENSLNKYVLEGRLSSEYLKVLILSPHTYSNWEIWDKCITDYQNYSDKTFLLNLYEKYGKYDLSRTLKSMHLMKYEKLMPEIINPLSKILMLYYEKDSSVLRSIIHRNLTSFIQFISEAYWNNRANIKNNEKLCTSFENILNILTSYNIAEAATILIEFQLL